MPHLPVVDDGTVQETPFPPYTRDQIQNCSYDSWYRRYRPHCLKSRFISLPSDVVSYLQEDGIILADEDDNKVAGGDETEDEWHSAGAQRTAQISPESSDDESEVAETNILPPNERFPATHELIKTKIKELGGAVAPKLNWSSPKDAKWISPHQNTLKCTSPNDIYLLLKSSIFASHDLGHAFDGCSPAAPARPFNPILVLRPFFMPHVALEFRCFVKHRSLIGITQRDLNFYAFLDDLRPQIWRKVVAFFRTVLRLDFPDSSFAFDVYIPEDSSAKDGLGRVRLIDFSPWTPKTDSLLFTWPELLDWEVQDPLYGSLSSAASVDVDDEETEDDTSVLEYLSDSDPEFRIVEKDDPAAYNFSSSEFSAHKLPKEVVDASLAGPGGLREFAREWKAMTEGRADSVWEHTTDQT